MAQLTNLECLQQRTIDVALPAALLPRGTFRRIDRPSYALVARRYLRVLADVPATDDGAQPFLAELRHELAGALARVEHLLHAGGPPHQRLEAEIELEWRCNQCEHWLGPAATATLDNAEGVPGALRAGGCLGHCEPKRARPSPPDVTDAELAAVGLLGRTVTLVGRFRRPPWRLPEGRVGLRSLVLLRLREAFLGVRRFIAAFCRSGLPSRTCSCKPPGVIKSVPAERT